MVSRWVAAKTVRKANAETIICYLEKNVFLRWGYPHALLTDNGKPLIGHKWKQKCNKLQLNHGIVNYHPRGNLNETCNGEIMKALQLRDRRRLGQKFANSSVHAAKLCECHHWHDTKCTTVWQEPTAILGTESATHIGGCPTNWRERSYSPVTLQQVSTTAVSGSEDARLHTAGRPADVREESHRSSQTTEVPDGPQMGTSLWRSFQRDSNHRRGDLPLSLIHI